MKADWVLFLIKLWLPLLITVTISSGASLISLTGCQSRCGDITVSFPFGIGPNCSRDGYSLHCNHTASGPKLFIVLSDGSSTEVTNISLAEGQVQIKRNVFVSYCSKNLTEDFPVQSVSTVGYGAPYTFSSTRNTLVTVGCNIVSYVEPINTADANGDSTACASVCVDGINKVRDGFCSGGGCCEASISPGTVYLDLRIASIRKEVLGNYSTVSCTNAFVADRDWFNFSREQLTDDNFFTQNSKVPVVLDWTIVTYLLWQSCSASMKYPDFACRSKNSICYDVPGSGGYRCKCPNGFEGNPYLSDGCSDIDECQQRTDHCPPGTCVNTIGSFSCVCPPGEYLVNDTFPFYTCVSYREVQSTNHLAVGIIIAICAGAVGLLIFGFSSFFLIIKLKQRNIRKHKEKCFHRNRGLLLEQLISFSDDNVERTKIFTLEELEKATNNFDNTRILGRGGHGAVYKGILSDQRIVAIKKAESVIQSEIEQFINEVAILSQINHRNVVKLFGCCLESEAPLLVYEFISGGTLSDHLHVDGNHISSLSFEDRLRIATEVAGALAYLHSAATISIFHRDIKSANILLDHNFTAKVADFGASRSVPSDKTRITTVVQGTFGYLDPEYYHTGQLTEKSDVYGFGVILVELLTGERAISQVLLRQEKSLAMHFIRSLQENRLFEVFDVRITEEGRKDALEAMAVLAEMCLRLKGDERPTMKTVEHKLNKLNKPKKQTTVNHQPSHRLKFDEFDGSIKNESSGSSTNNTTTSYVSENGTVMHLNHTR